MDSLLIIGGLALLVFGANWLVDGASSIADKFGISPLTIGLTVVAFGTSMPELIVNVLSSASGNSELAIGNVIGSNTFNIFLILGVAAIIKPIQVQSKTVKIEVPFSLLAALVLLVLANDVFLNGESKSILTLSDGLIFLSFFIVFMFYTFINARKPNDSGEITIKKYKMSISTIMVIGGLGLLFLGGKFVVDGAVSIATFLGVSQSLIGLTIVAAGTSLPELATTAVAAYKNNSDMAIGNVVGSNIFNIFFILGVSSIIKPLPFYASSNIDILVTCLASMLLFIFVLIGPGKQIDRKEGGLFIGLYIAYTIYLISNS
ncbi:MAG: calcium/sodium antiporter [Tenuifilaceae bacterium]